LNLAEFAIHQQIKTNRRLRAYRQDSAWKVIRQRVVHCPLQQVIECRDEASSVQIEHVLRHDDQPMLLGVAKGVNSAEQSSFFLT
jgi:hypothetical protein